MRLKEEWDVVEADNYTDEEVPARFSITVTFTVQSDSLDNAQEEVKDLIEHGVLALADEEREPVHEWDVIEAEPVD